MKNAVIAVLLCALQLTARNSHALPSFSGSDGLVRVATGEGRDARGLEIALAGDGWGYTTSNGQGSRGTFFKIDLTPRMNFCYSRHWEFSAAAGFALVSRNDISTAGMPETATSTVTGLQDTRLGVKYSLQRGKFLVGGYAGYDLPTLDKKFYAGRSRHRGTLTLLLMPGVRLGAARIDANIGYQQNDDRWDSISATAATASGRARPGTSIPLALGLSYGVEYAMVSAELSGAYRRDSKLPGVLAMGAFERTKRFLLNDPLWLAVGLKITHKPEYYSFYSLEYNLQGSDDQQVADKGYDHWHVLAGIGLGLMERRIVPALRSTITGTVTDPEGRGMPATVTIAEIVYLQGPDSLRGKRAATPGDGVAIETDSTSGRYIMSGLKIDGRPAEIRLMVDPKDKKYLPKMASWLITGQQPVIQTPVIVLEPSLGVLRGRVADSAGHPLRAVIALSDPRTAPFATDADGSYRVEVKPDVYQAVVRAPRHNSDSFSVSVHSRDTVDRNVRLRPVPQPGETFVFRDIEFTSAKPFFKGDAVFSRLQEIYALLADNPTIKVNIGVHTDDLAGVRRSEQIADDRALAVVRYLISRGIDPSRMTPVGYGSQLPVADNRTRAGRRLNRRVEVTVVE